MKALLRTATFAVFAVACTAFAAEGPEKAVPTSSPAAKAASAEPGARSEPVFHIQIWDGHKTGWNDEALEDLKKSGFTIVQNGWNGSLFPSASLLAKMRQHGLLYGAYLDTRYLFRVEAFSEEKNKVRAALSPAGEASKGDFNTFDPVYQSVVLRGIEKGFYRMVGAEGLYKVMLNSEHGAPISYDDLTVAEAVKAGVMKEGQRIPFEARGVWRERGEFREGEFADPYRFFSWFAEKGGNSVINGVAAAGIRGQDPAVLVTTDPIMDGFCYGLYGGMDIQQDWIRIHLAPRDPLSIAYRLERHKAHVRYDGGAAPSGGKREIWIGPQLGTNLRGGGSFGAPADAFEEALWLAVGFGARGITCWGYNSIRRDNALDTDTWGRVKKFREKLLGDYPFLLAAEDEPRNCAVLLSKANLVYTERAYYAPDENYEHFYRVVLTAHIPADVVYDRDVFDGKLARYKALFLPGIEHTVPELDAKIAEFEAAGGRVIRWPFIGPRYVDYEITKGSAREDTDVTKYAGQWLYPHQYRAWRRCEAQKLFESVQDLLEVRVDNPDVIVNIIRIDGRRYALFVNDSRTYGAWTAERGYRWFEDEGRAAEATVTIGRGEEARTAKVSLGPAGIALLPL